MGTSSSILFIAKKPILSDGVVVNANNNKQTVSVSESNQEPEQAIVQHKSIQHTWGPLAHTAVLIHVFSCSLGSSLIVLV